MFRFSFEEFRSQMSGVSLFVFRENGAKCFPIIQESLDSLPAGEVLVVELPKMTIVDYSFVDETIGRLYEEVVGHKHGDRYMVISAGDDNVLDTVEASLAMRELTALASKDGVTWRLIGLRTRDELAETATFLLARKQLTTEDYVNEYGLSITAANNRLFRLYEAGLAKRSPNPENSRQFIYSSLI